VPILTKRYLDNITPAEKEKIHWDSNYKGFGVRASPKGRKTFVVQYRQGSRTRRVSLGTFGNLTVDEARKKAKRILGEVASGYDPAEKIKLFRETPTMEEVCKKFLKQHVEQHLKPSTQKEYERNIRLYILPKFRTFKVSEISREDISKAHFELADKPYQANRNLGVLSKILNLCEIWGYRTEGSNPCRHVKKYKEKKREVFMSLDQVTNLFDVLDQSVINGSEKLHVASAFKLIILTGCRLGEIQTLMWSYIEQSHFKLPDSKTGHRWIPLSIAALGVIEAIPRVLDNPHVIVGAKSGQHCTDLQKPWRRIRNKAKIPHVRIHDLRHTFASHAVMAGHPLPVVGRLLGHTQIQTTMRYAHLADSKIMEATNSISNLFLGRDHEKHI